MQVAIVGGLELAEELEKGGGVSRLFRAGRGRGTDLLSLFRALDGCETGFWDWIAAEGGMDLVAVVRAGERRELRSSERGLR